MAILYIAPTAKGTGDGSSAANAASIKSIDAIIQKAGAGGEVRILADQGKYTISSQLQITKGGVEGSPVTIRGVDSSGKPAEATFVSDRAEAWTVGATTGSEVFRLLAGADNLTFSNMKFVNVGNGAFRIAGDISNLTIENMAADNVQRFIEDRPSGSSTTASVDGLIVRNVVINGYSKNAIRLAYDSQDILIENVIADSEGQDGDNFAVGIHLTDTVHDVVIKNTTMKNNISTVTAYWNGDGFATEENVYNVRFENTISTGNADAGYDIKSSNTVLINAYASDNARNYRFWSDTITLENSTGDAPRLRGGTGGAAQVWLNEGATAQIVNSDFTNTGKAVLYDLTYGNATLLVDRVVSDVAGSQAKVGAGSVLLGGLVQKVEASLSATAKNSSVALAISTASTTAVTGVLGKSETLVGTKGDDIITRISTTIKELIGGTGDDVYFVDDRTLIVTEAANGGSDHVYSTVSFTLPAEVERLTLTGVAGNWGTGNQLDNILNGNSGANMLTGMEGNDILNGGAGADLLIGGLGDDLYIIDSLSDRIIERAGEGVDTVASSVSFSLAGQNLERLVLLGSDPLTATGNALGNSIIGNSGANAITGGSGADIIDGGLGADTMSGLAGDDTYFVGQTGDKVIERAGEGIDTVITDLASYTLSDNVENLTFSGATSFSGVGNALANTLRGGDKADVLNGGAGADILIGGAGADRLTGGAGADAFVLAAAGQGDVITDFESGVDKIQVATASLGVSAPGAVSFRLSTAATVSGPTIIYDKATGGVFWDATGGDAKDQVLLVGLSNKPATLTLDSFSFS